MESKINPDLENVKILASNYYILCGEELYQLVKKTISTEKHKCLINENLA